MCAACGKEAAPYIECHDCRMTKRVCRFLNKAAEIGFMLKTGQGARAAFKLAEHPTHEQIAAYNSLQCDPTKTAAPRMNNRPLNVEDTLVAILTHIGRPSTTEEMVSMWGKMRMQPELRFLARPQR
jgi:hypothetical protein